MNDRSAIAWLARRVGFGLGPGQLDGLAAIGRGGGHRPLVDPDAHGVAPSPDPWRSVGLESYDPQVGGAPLLRRRRSMPGWPPCSSTPRPLEEWMRWFWHGHFVSTLAVVKDPRLLVGQLRMLGDLGPRRLPDAAPRGDGRRGHARLPRRHRQPDRRGQRELRPGGPRAVRPGRRATTPRRTSRPAHAPSPAGTSIAATDRSCSARPSTTTTPQQYLGRSGVHDVDTVVDAIVGHESCAPFITRKLADRDPRARTSTDDLVAQLASDFAAVGPADPPPGAGHPGGRCRRDVLDDGRGAGAVDGRLRPGPRASPRTTSAGPCWSA